MNSITPTFLFLGVALLLWSVSLGLSNYLGQGYTREHAHSAPQTQTEVPQSLQQLEEAATAQPDSIDAHLALAFGRLEHALQHSDAKVIMASVQSFQRVLELSPEHPQALLGLATLCNQAGILDKAIEYYERYLKQKPDDLRARSDFALALVRGGDLETAATTVEMVLAQNGDFIPALMTSAVIHRSKGDIDGAERQARKALALEEDPAVKKEIERFVSELKNPEKANETESVGAEQASKTKESPAALVQQFFQNHSIIGPKLRRISWKDSVTAIVEVENFPVEQMPPFAKSKFIGSVQEMLARAGNGISIVLVDSASSRELMAIESAATPSENAGADAAAAPGDEERGSKESAK